MKELFLMLAHIMPEDRLIKELEDALQHYKSKQTEDHKMKLGLWCNLLISKWVIKDEKGGLESVMKEMDKMKQGYDLLNTKNQ